MPCRWRVIVVRKERRRVYAVVSAGSTEKLELSDAPRPHPAYQPIELCLDVACTYSKRQDSTRAYESARMRLEI